MNRHIHDAEIAMREAVIKWLNACGWTLHDNYEYWVHQDLGQADDMWAAARRQLDQ